MKKGFTMIELIFVIVILGILAAVAIPRLAATRDDAEVAKAATNITTIISDIGSYYTSQASFADTMANMTNVALDDDGKIEDGVGSAGLLAAGKQCLSLTLNAEVETAEKKSPAYLVVADGSDTTSTICKKIQNDPAVVKLKTGEFVPQKCKTPSEDKKSCVEWENDTAVSGIPLIGLSVVR